MKQDARLRELNALDGIGLRTAIKRLGLKQKDIAKAFDVTEGAVSLGLNDSTGKAEHRTDMRAKIIDYLVKYEAERNSKKSTKRNLRAA